MYASVRGRDVETGDRLTVSGEVVGFALGPNRVTASVTLSTGAGEIEIGGQTAAYEDVEATELLVDRGSPPGI